MPATMLAPKFRRSHMGAVGRPSPRAVDLTPEQQKQIADSVGKIGGAIVDTIAGTGKQPALPSPPPKKDHTAAFILAAVVAAGIYFLRKK